MAVTGTAVIYHREATILAAATCRECRQQQWVRMAGYEGTLAACFMHLPAIVKRKQAFRSKHAEVAIADYGTGVRVEKRLPT